MLQFTLNEISDIVNSCGIYRVVDWKITNLTDKLIGYLGDHLKLIVKVESDGNVSDLIFFVKCLPINDKSREDYIRSHGFFKKEFAMFNDLFKKFSGDQGPGKWRPRALLLKEEIFIFEDLTELGYKMPHHQSYLNYDEITAVVKTLAKFHAQSYIYEEKKSIALGRPYSIWEDYGEYLQESDTGQGWRNAGKNAVIAFLIKYSKYKSIPQFAERLDMVIPKLYETAWNLMKPSSTFRNAVVHRDLWTNNIFFKRVDQNNLHSLIIDFQTVLYCSPMLDLSSLLYFNTSPLFRQRYLDDIIDLYYDVMSQELSFAKIDIDKIFDKASLIENYEKSVLFGITQGAIIVPIVAMCNEDRTALFCNPETYQRVNEVSRGDEFIQVAQRDDTYRHRVTELFDELVERYVCPINIVNKKGAYNDDPNQIGT